MLEFAARHKNRSQNGKRCRCAEVNAAFAKLRANKARLSDVLEN